MYSKWCVMLIGLGLMGFAGESAGQAPIEVRSAQLASGFGGTDGNLILVADQLVFVESDDPSRSFAVTRSNVERVDRRDDVVTLTLRARVRGQDQVMFRLGEPGGVEAWYADGGGSSTAAVADARGDVLLTYQVRHDHVIGGCTGRLLVMTDRLAFESLDERNDSRQWVYEDISEVSQNGIYQLQIRPFLGNQYNLELIGRGMDSQQYRELVERIANARAR